MKEVKKQREEAKSMEIEQVSEGEMIVKSIRIYKSKIMDICKT